MQLHVQNMNSQKKKPFSLKTWSFLNPNSWNLKYDPTYLFTCKATVFCIEMNRHIYTGHIISTADRILNGENKAWRGIDSSAGMNSAPPNNMLKTADWVWKGKVIISLAPPNNTGLNMSQPQWLTIFLCTIVPTEGWTQLSIKKHILELSTSNKEFKREKPLCLS